MFHTLHSIYIFFAHRRGTIQVLVDYFQALDIRLTGSQQFSLKENDKEKYTYANEKYHTKLT